MSLRCVSPPLLYPLSLLRKEPHIFQSAMYKILVLSLFYLYTDWGHAVLMVVPLKLFVKPPFFFISFAKLLHVIPEYIQETPSFFFFTSVSPKRVNSKKKKKKNLKSYLHPQQKFHGSEFLIIFHV